MKLTAYGQSVLLIVELDGGRSTSQMEQKILTKYAN